KLDKKSLLYLNLARQYYRHNLFWESPLAPSLAFPHPFYVYFLVAVIVNAVKFPLASSLVNERVTASDRSQYIKECFFPLWYLILGLLCYPPFQHIPHDFGKQ